MKKFLYLSLLLTITGAVFAFALLYSHYKPEANLLFLSCGSGLENPCITVSQSAAGSIFGIPLAAFGLLFYLFILFSLLIADYAQGEYTDLAVFILLPLTAAALLLDVFLAVMLIQLGEFCTLCFYTYLVNLALFVVAFLWFRSIRRDRDDTFMAQLKALLTIEETGSHKRAAFSSFMLFSILLVFAIFSTNTIMMYKTGGPTISSRQVQKFIGNFYRQKPVEINLPKSPYILGDPEAPVTLSVFTDYLCSACYGFYKVEKFLLAKYKGKVKIVYYHYPLDNACNQDVGRAVYKNSCFASRAMHAAVKTGIYSEYLVEHFKNYKQLKKDYSEEWSTQILSDLQKKGIAKNVTVDIFRQMMFSEETTAMIESQINAAMELKVDATPTIIIAGRTLRGVPPKEMMSALIDNELRKH